MGGDSLRGWLRAELLLDLEAGGSRLRCLLCARALPSLHLGDIRRHALAAHPASLSLGAAERGALLRACGDGAGNGSGNGEEDAAGGEKGGDWGPWGRRQRGEGGGRWGHVGWWGGGGGVGTMWGGGDDMESRDSVGWWGCGDSMGVWGQCGDVGT